MIGTVDDLDEQLMDRQVAWAHTYDGCQRLAGDPLALARLLRPAREEWRQTEQVPAWCGVDLLRLGGRSTSLAPTGTAVGTAWPRTATSGRSGMPCSTGSRLTRPVARGNDHRFILPDQPTRLSRLLSAEPRMHRDVDFLLAKQARWFEPHIAPVNALVQEIARTVGCDVPYVDPDCGGVNARVLLLLEAPAGAAAHGSHMLSADNDDGTAANVWRAYAALQLARSLERPLERRAVVHRHPQQDPGSQRGGCHGGTTLAPPAGRHSPGAASA